ncbi:uncharacterized protein [Haliotis asinina]|uniref:uncharacterized protein n=1 Tax=Haliotis asinina TaxID=109174 RepID=UPI0035326F77
MALARVGSDCELKVDCVSLPNSHCNDGVCRCDVGYGPDGDSCRILTECSTFSNNFTLYKNLVIGGHDILNRPSSNHESCPEACISTNGCKSADLDFQANICYMNTHTFRGVPVADQQNSLFFDFFQRECLW